MTYSNLAASDMYEIVSRCDYVLSLLKSPDYEDNIMSGSVPLAFTCHARLIMPRAYIKGIGLKSPLALEDFIQQKEPLRKVDDAAAKNIMDEFINLKTMRDVNFSEILRLETPSETSLT